MHVLPILLSCGAFRTEPLVDQFSLMQWVPKVRTDSLFFDARWVGLSNTPAGDFETEVKLLHDGEVLHSLRASQVRRVDSMAYLQMSKPVFTIPAKAGGYKVSVEIDGALAGGMDFTLKPGGPSGWIVSGPWQTHGWLAYPKSGQNNGVNFTYYISSNDVSGGKEPKVEVRFVQGSKVLFTGGAGISIYSDLIIKKETPLLKPDRQWVRMTDIAKLNGSFAIQIVVNGSVARTYKGSISGGKFVAHPGSASADPMKFLSPERLTDSATRYSNEFVWLTTQ